RSALNLITTPRAAFDGFVGESPYPYVNNNPLRSIDPTGLFPQTPKDSITTRIESLIGRGRAKELRDSLFSHEDDFPPQVREKLLKQCRNVLDRKAKKSANALRTNKKYNDWFHRTFKKELPKGVSRNRDATPEDLVEAFERFFGVP
ncbi:MAG: hypothetical protein Q8P12_02430, partial [bacterium]|nr:hypothetical protein [bacterium]